MEGRRVLRVMDSLADLLAFSTLLLASRIALLLILYRTLYPCQ